MATMIDTTLFSRTKTSAEPVALAPATKATQVRMTSASGGASTVSAEIIALRAQIQKAIDAGIHFRGAVSSTSPLPAASYTAGWQYVVGEAGTYAGQTCEVGDYIICVKDYASGSASNADWVVLQNNLDGAVTGPATSTADHIVVFNGTSGKTIKDSGFTIAKSVPANAEFTDTQSDWSQTDATKKDYIKNKPTIPTKVSAFENDKGYLTEHQSLAGYAKTAELATVATSGSYNDLTDKPTTPSTIPVDSALSTTSTNPVQNKVVNEALAGKMPITPGGIELVPPVDGMHGGFIDFHWNGSTEDYTSRIGEVVKSGRLDVDVPGGLYVQGRQVATVDQIPTRKVVISASREAVLTAGTVWTVPQHTVGGDELLVWIEGLLCTRGVEYTDVSSTTITFTSDIPTYFSLVAEVVN